MAIGLSGSNGEIGNYKPLSYYEFNKFISKYSKLSKAKEGLIKKLEKGD